MCIVFFVVQVRTATPPGLYEQCKQETKALELSQVHFSADGKEIVVEVYSNVCIAHFGLIIFEHVKTINWFFVCDFNRCHGRCCRCQTFLPMWKSSQRFVKPFLLIVCFFRCFYLFHHHCSSVFAPTNSESDDSPPRNQFPFVPRQHCSLFHMHTQTKMEDGRKVMI